MIDINSYKHCFFFFAGICTVLSSLYSWSRFYCCCWWYYSEVYLHISNNSLDLSFRVNGSAVLQSVFDKGFQQLHIVEELGYKVFRRNLTVIVSSLYNNTKIHCKAYGSQMDVKSKVAVLTVQGFERTKIFWMFSYFS